MSKQNSNFRKGQILKINTGEYTYILVVEAVHKCKSDPGWLGCEKCGSPYKYDLYKYGRRKSTIALACLDMFFAVPISKEEANLSLY